MTRWLGVLAVVVAACGGDGASGDPDAAWEFDAACERRSPTPDGLRRGVVSLPYSASGGQASTYRVFELDPSGNSLTFTNETFEMGRTTIGTIVFTPDREIGLVAQEDGSLGVFRIDRSYVTVVHRRFQGSFYAEQVVMDPGGFFAYVLDPNTRENGGGIYTVGIACDGTLTDHRLLLPARSPRKLVLVSGAEAVLAAADVGVSSPAGHDVHWMDMSANPPERVTGADAFGDDEAIVGGLVVTRDRRFVLVGDTSQFSGVPNRVAVVEITGVTTLTPRQVLTPVEDPLAIVTSPLNDAALVVSGFGDALLGLDYTPGGAAPFSVRGPLTYTGARPELPGHAVMIGPGTLSGMTLIAENLGVRRVRFGGNGTVIDLGKTETGTGTENIIGAIGIQQ